MNILNFNELTVNENINIHYEDTNSEKRFELLKKYAKYTKSKLEDMFLEAIDYGCEITSYELWLLNGDGSQIGDIQPPINVDGNKYMLNYKISFTKRFDKNIIYNTDLTITDMNDFFDEVRNINNIMLKLGSKMNELINKEHKLPIKPVFFKDNDQRDFISYHIDFITPLPPEFNSDFYDFILSQLTEILDKKVDRAINEIKKLISSRYKVQKNLISIEHIDLYDFMDQVMRDEDVSIPLGIFYGDELYPIAFYSVKKETYDIEQEELNRFLEDI